MFTHRISARARRVTLTLVATLSCCALFVTGALAMANAPEPQAAGLTIYLPNVTKPGQTTQPTPTQPPTQPTQPPTQPPATMPAELVGTWFHGQLLNKQFYDPENKTWQDPGGVAHMYIFEANGNYVLASYLKLQTGLGCVSQVWKYETGSANVEDANILVTPNSSRTRTKIDCGSHSDQELEGDHGTRAVPWQLAQDEKGHTKLLLSEDNNTTDYFKDGIAAQVLGNWRMGEVTSHGFYDPTTGQWATPTGAGEWLQLNADGSYRYGGVAYGSDNQGCQLTGLVYQEGTLTGSGSRLTMKPTKGRRHIESECTPGEAFEDDWFDSELGEYAWNTQGNPATQLELLRLIPFEQRTFVRDE